MYVDAKWGIKKAKTFLMAVWGWHGAEWEVNFFATMYPNKKGYLKYNIIHTLMGCDAFKRLNTKVA